MKDKNDLGLDYCLQDLLVSLPSYWHPNLYNVRLPWGQEQLLASQDVDNKFVSLYIEKLVAYLHIFLFRLEDKWKEMGICEVATE